MWHVGGAYSIVSPDKAEGKINICEQLAHKSQPSAPYMGWSIHIATLLSGRAMGPDNHWRTYV